MRKSIIVGNWKMNGSQELIKEFLESFNSNFNRKDLEVVVCPPEVLLISMKNAMDGTGVFVGAQNVHTETKGAYTGETSAQLLRECGVNWCIVGHSERREQFGETDDMISRKIENLISNDIKPILCVGETLEQRESGNFKEVVIKQLRRGFSRLAANSINRCVIAYEPVWAIGTGKTSDPVDANKMHKEIRNEIASLSSKEGAKKMPIIYGGSVNNENAEDLISNEEIDGALVGGASLNSKAFKKIIGYSQ
mgnify:CR=1 FL=1